MGRLSYIIDKYIKQIESIEENNKEIKIGLESIKNSGQINLSNFIGQESTIDSLRIAIESCKIKNNSLNHILFYGAPGLGKSLLASAIAGEMQSKQIKILGSELSNKNVIDRLTTFLRLKSKNKIVFIDEIHNIPLKTAEILYDPIQDFYLLGEKIEPFTLIGATTYVGKIPRPLRERFDYCYKLDSYSVKNISDIIMLKDKDFSKEIADYIAERSKGIPRIANHYCIQIKNAAVSDNCMPSIRHAKFFMSISSISDNGLNKEDISILKTLASSNQAISKNTLCSITYIDQSEYEFVIEPYLLKLGYIQITPKGRIITPVGLNYLISNGGS